MLTIARNLPTHPCNYDDKARISETHQIPSRHSTTTPDSLCTLSIVIIIFIQISRENVPQETCCEISKSQLEWRGEICRLFCTSTRSSSDTYDFVSVSGGKNPIFDLLMFALRAAALNSIQWQTSKQTTFDHSRIWMNSTLVPHNTYSTYLSTLLARVPTVYAWRHSWQLFSQCLTPYQRPLLCSFAVNDARFVR